MHRFGLQMIMVAALAVEYSLQLPQARRPGKLGRRQGH
jgi:hypothetical protein